MSELKDFDDLVKVADWFVNDYDRDPGSEDDIREYALSIYEVTGWCVADFVNVYFTSLGEVDEDPFYGGEYDIETQIKAACLHWLRTDVEERLLRE